MTEASHGMRLMRRVIHEHRRVVVLLTAAFVLNILAYAFIVRPLARSVANVEQSTLAAEQALAAARAEHATASGTLTGKDRASKELMTFYADVLPQDQSGARRLTYGRVARLAAQSRLQYHGGKYESVADRESSLVRFKANVDLTGNYADMRAFIHALETAPEFVVIDNVDVAEGSGGDGSLRLTIQLSTYFRGTAQ